ncbi:hypothetical protein F0562_026802 [Nyssa sinensis]|uniref:WAT1-related protein n=1 Tax=Nyssa sinensis TaxID=561372 RepID=A0A5J5BCL5_9ASTE|nr:hypothetical protein F0562_026802 [Nyssa sinensis]
MEVKKWIVGSRAVTSMLMVQLFTTGLQLLSKVILSEGTFIFALMTYRHVVAAFCVSPFAFFWERGKAEKLNWSVLFWLFMNALTGISMAMGVEKLGLNKKAGKLKTLGAILCVAGALTISLYKGKALHIGHHSEHQHAIVKETKPNWARGTIFLVCSILSYATWFLVQGALATAASFCLISWAIAKRGPTYPSMFNPLSLIFVSITEALFLGEEITVGSLLGMLLIVAGLYSFLWGKSKESKSMVAPKGADFEAVITVLDSAGMQLTATVLPTVSPSNDTTYVEDVSDVNQREALETL